VALSDRALAAAVARAATARVRGTFERHVSPSVDGLFPSAAGGRWGPSGAYRVLYLGRPTESVIAEAYRLLVDPVEGMTADLVGPRRLLRCDVRVSKILDLRDDETRDLVRLDVAALAGPHPLCQRVGEAAHRAGMHGIVAPAATALGETLALFETNLPAAERPKLSGRKTWRKLPPDPRRLRRVDPPR
jgi:RES domain-containing protein